MHESSQSALLKQLVKDEDALYLSCTSESGPFPLKREPVKHYGTMQHYLCWQKNDGNSQVLMDMPELWKYARSKFCNREFLVLDDTRMTYGDVLTCAQHLAQELVATHGATKHTTVAIAGRNTPQWVIGFVAVSGFLGGVVLPLNSWATDDDLYYCLKDSETDILLVDGERLAKTSFKSCVGLRIICMNLDNHKIQDGAVPTLIDAIRQGETRLSVPWPSTEHDQVAMLMYTSGTTSKPKGVLLTQRAIMSAINMLRLMEYDPQIPDPCQRPQTVQLVPVPLFHINGTHNMLLSGGAAGRKLVLMKKWSALDALHLIEAEKVQVLMGVPTMTYEIMKHKDFDTSDLSSLQGIGGGGAPFAAPMVAEVSQKFKHAKAKTGYGLTETSSTVSMFGGDMFGLVPKSVGRLAWNIEGCVLDSNNKKLPRGGVGELCIHGATIMSHYLKQPAKTEDAFHVDVDGKLWFRTGDIGRIEEGGFIYIMDRAKDMIIRGGENISCKEVEDCFYERKEVSECAAFGLPDERLGETVAAAIILKGKEVQRLVDHDPDDSDLRAHAMERLAYFKVPQRIFRWPGSNLPRGDTGKLLKKAIREEVLAMVASEAISATPSKL